MIIPQTPFIWTVAILWSVLLFGSVFLVVALRSYLYYRVKSAYGFYEKRIMTVVNDLFWIIIYQICHFLFPKSTPAYEMFFSADHYYFIIDGRMVDLFYTYKLVPVDSRDKKRIRIFSRQVEICHILPRGELYHLRPWEINKLPSGS